MDASVTQLLPLYQRERAAGRAMALALVLDTAGSTYTKSGALLLIASDGEYAGLLSGGCLEGDLRERARTVIADGRPQRVSYDMRGPDDELWGLGAGCEGAMDILMLRVGADEDWQPLHFMQQTMNADARASLAIVVESTRNDMPVGRVLLPAAPGQSQFARYEAARLFVLPVEPPPRLLLLGAGPDAVPVCGFAQQLGWKVTLYDHRAANLQSGRFVGADVLLTAPPEELPSRLRLTNFSAAVVMSHHLRSDLAYLRALAHSTIGYVGLLGPAPRREKLGGELGADAALLAGRLHSPVGLALGGRSPASIALSIVAEIHAWLHDAPGGSYGAQEP